jgi:methyltransferase (TIGR00027 family)
VSSERAVSNTAHAVMVLRAVHQLVDDEPKILVDPVAVRLLDEESREGIRNNPEHFRRGMALALRAHVVIRSRFAEDRLAAAVGRGVTQFVVLGAGYDTFAFRQPDWARMLRIFEVDHAASQQAKRERLAAANIPLPPNVTFAAVDFEHETLLAGLARSGFDPQQPTFVSCLGVLVYLTAEAVEGVFRFAASLVPGSEIVATFRGQRVAGEPVESPVAAAAAAAGEPWISSFDPAGLRRQLMAMGFSDVSLITGPELEVRYAMRRTDGLHPPGRMMMVSAKV